MSHNISIAINNYGLALICVANTEARRRLCSMHPVVAGQPAHQLRGRGRAGARAGRGLLLAARDLLHHRREAGFLARPPRLLLTAPLLGQALPRSLSWLHHYC